MTEKTQYEKVLIAGGFTEYHKEILQTYYDDAIAFLVDAGVPEDIARSDLANGCITRYILDTYSMNSNEVKLSPFFFQRLKQLQRKCLEVASDEKVTES